MSLKTIPGAGSTVAVPLVFPGDLSEDRVCALIPRPAWANYATVYASWTITGTPVGTLAPVGAHASDGTAVTCRDAVTTLGPGQSADTSCELTMVQLDGRPYFGVAFDWTSGGTGALLTAQVTFSE